MAAEDTFLTLAKESEGFYKEKGSKFIAFAYPVRSEDDIKERLDALRKKYYDARHHCYAWVLGRHQDKFRANDDGEPGHSAGDPILGQIKSNNLTNTLIVVIRYFGGTKLGVSGLINAYKVSAAEAIEENEIIEEIVKETLNFSFDYIKMNDVMKIIKDFDLEILNQVFEMNCEFSLLIREAVIQEVKAKLEKIETLNFIEEE
ncbi:IMPACT family protein [Aureibacter tunicatorum]|uniref:YigZ family protein n=1 Tax=Aureibacter tunicatorum TaxID=866807 RepID=A0AAE3XJS8_9BACT|nr:YigZ family protein [Aureibacter tunicatorum]MDR6237933.1 putative YigZ family protein [Aureibacter tunicatorum]BDD02966.1 hypothetical protein AUTU_04490 [Aureibacter tunicatorum]